MKKDFDLNEYDYELPEELIAKTPTEHRDHSWLLPIKAENADYSLDVFKNLDNYLPAGSLLVVNDTKVVPARVDLKKQTGGRVEILFLINEYDKGTRKIKGLSDRKIDIGSKLFFDEENFIEVIGQKENIFYFSFNFLDSLFFELIEKHGKTPLPKYLGGNKIHPESFLRNRYQSIFAQNPASIAAPTASLHFTGEVLEKIKDKDIDIVFVTLHVGLGTFATLDEQNIAEGILHDEWYEITTEVARDIREAKASGRKIIAVGTTVVRALESSAEDILGGKVGKIYGKTNIFIKKPFKFKIIDGLVTNFHLPKSSLMCLVDAFLDFKKCPKNLVYFYKIAIKEKMRFYSFGDAMFIL